MDHISYVGIIIVLILTGCGLPLPEEVPIVAAGIGSAVGTLNPWGAFVACVVGALLGDSVIFAVGYHFGHSLLTAHPRFAHLLHAEHQATIEQKLRRHGLKVLFLARFMVGIRAPVYLTAGTLRMSYRQFILIDAFCATCVVGLFFGLSYAYGEQLTTWIRRSEIGFTVLVVVVLCVLASVFIIKRARQKRLDHLTAEPSEPEPCGVGPRDTKELPH